MTRVQAFANARAAIASLPADASNDAIGSSAPTLETLYAPETHAAALDPTTPIVEGARGAGKSFWAGVLYDPALRTAAGTAYPHLGLGELEVAFGYSGIEGPEGVGRDKLDSCVSPDASPAQARAFFWATILRALPRTGAEQRSRLSELLSTATDPESREEAISRAEHDLGKRNATVVVVYDALDTLAASWPRRRLLTQALLEVVWAMRAYRRIRMKLFVRPDQLADADLRFVELPKLRAGTVRLTWAGADLYGMLFARLALGTARKEFGEILAPLGLAPTSQKEVLARRWPLSHDIGLQEKAMAILAGAFMGDGSYGFKKGKTYDWPINHLGDAFGEVTPRSFLMLMIAAAKHGLPPPDRVITPAGITHGLRAASKSRVEQLHQEFPWIKGVLAPLSGLLLPQEERKVFGTWRKAKTLDEARIDAERHGYLPAVPPELDDLASERALYLALENIGVMFRRKDERIDMPDLFRVAAKLLKKGATAPL